MAKVALVSPPFVADYMRNARCDFVSLSHSSWYPIWLGQAGAYLESRGHRTLLLDAQVMGQSRTHTLDALGAFRPDVVAVYTGRMSEESDVEFGDAVAAIGPQVVFVGPYTSIQPQAVLRRASRARLAIAREFDLPLEELASGRDPRATGNVHVREEGSDAVHSSPIRPLYPTSVLDTFPITSEYFHRQLDVRRYKTPSELYPFLDVMSGRGCAWGRCNFCLWVQTFVPGTVYHRRSIEHFMGEFEYVTRFMPAVKSIMIQDDMLTAKRAMEISEAILRRGTRIRWSCYAKPNSKFTQETFCTMARAGCLNLHVGFESGDDAILANIDKGSTAEDAREFAALAHRAGLRIHGDFAMGHLGETRESMRRTLELAKAIDPHTAQFQILIPFKGTRFWRELDEGRAWNDSGEPSYERAGGASAQEIRSFAKRAYREFYLSGSYARKIVSEPKEYFWNRFDQYRKAIPAVTWRRWVK